MPNNIYGIHDEAKDKDFELELNWVCDESNRQHQKGSRIHLASTTPRFTRTVSEYV
ncbi:hypothetical protein TIFTF001_032158 [Ficus carica]|uniref:Uncharacterized protein n=1 Tax=Ficus carica TaxID=3494 RepID=A0AA88DW71_FICCA|nr:hypothetical protein TIFTF001_032158 [Ficus carica]